MNIHARKTFIINAVAKLQIEGNISHRDAVAEILDVARNAFIYATYGIDGRSKKARAILAAKKKFEKASQELYDAMCELKEIEG